MLVISKHLSLSLYSVHGDIKTGTDGEKKRNKKVIIVCNQQRCLASGRNIEINES